jgi:ATP-dependent DNA helicase RecG
MAFVEKHLPDRFHLEGSRRVSLRNLLFREVVSNLLIHREYENSFPAKIIMMGDRLHTENWNRQHTLGAIDPQNFVPHPKNPVIANFFKEIGLADELGSGLRKAFKYTPIYTPGGAPWQMTSQMVGRKFGVKFGVKVRRSDEKILEAIFHDRYASALSIASKIGISQRAVEKNLAFLKREGIIERIGSDKNGYWMTIK